MDNQVFDLYIEQIEEKWRVRASSPLVGEVPASYIELPFSERKSTFANIVGALSREIDKESFFAQQSKDLEEKIKTWGSELFKAVFTDEIVRQFDQANAIAKSENTELHLRLRLNVPELNDLPWECLYDSRQQGFIALLEKTPILRYLEVSQPVESLAVKPPLKVLVVISAPKDLRLLDVEKEWQDLQAAVKDLERQSLIELTRLETATLQELRRELSLTGKQYHVLHFIGHGDFDKKNQQGVLAFENKDCKKHMVNSEKLATVLKNHEPLRLIFLNACKGAVTSTDTASDAASDAANDTAESNLFAGMAQSLVSSVGVPAVIAMQFAITDNAAITLTGSFYKGLTVGKSVPGALTSARVTVNTGTENELGWVTPVLFMRSSNGYLFNLQELTEAEKKERVAELWEQVKILSKDI